MNKVNCRTFKNRPIKVGLRALVLPINHPSPNVSNKRVCITTPVIASWPTGFETKNTIYTIVGEVDKC